MENVEKRLPGNVGSDDARGGVTGHNVRYVLAFGLGGIIAAYAAIGIYFGYDHLVNVVSQAWSGDPVAVISSATPYLLILALGATAGVLLYNLLNLASGPSDNATQTGMRARVVMQFTLICVIMAMLYFSSGT